MNFLLGNQLWSQTGPTETVPWFTYRLFCFWVLILFFTLCFSFSEGQSHFSQDIPYSTVPTAALTIVSTIMQAPQRAENETSWVIWRSLLDTEAEGEVRGAAVLNESLPSSWFLLTNTWDVSNTEKGEMTWDNWNCDDLGTEVWN